MRFCLRKQTIFFAIFWVGLALFLTSYQNLRKFVERHHWPITLATTYTTTTMTSQSPTTTTLRTITEILNTTTLQTTTTTTTTTLLDNTKLNLINITAKRQFPSSSSMNGTTTSSRRPLESQCPLASFMSPEAACNVTMDVMETKLSLFKRLPPQYSKMVAASSLPLCSRVQPWLTHQHMKEMRGQQRGGKLMIFLIKSAAPNFARRSMIRQTWGSVAFLYEMRFLLVFALGLSPDQETQDFIMKENKEHGDLLQCEFTDTYRMLPEKVLSAFGWLVKEDVTTDYVTVTDDDCMMNLKNVYRAFRIETDNNFIYCGFQYGKNRRPVSEAKSKWYISKEVYSETVYPAFCHGGMWTLSMPLIKKIYCAAETTNRNGFHLEDVYITGILRRKVSCTEANVVDRWRFRMVKHVAARSTLYRTFLGFWKVWNRTLPWYGEPGQVRLREPRQVQLPGQPGQPRQPRQLQPRQHLL